VQEAGGPVNRIERSAREFDRWQQHQRPIAFVVAVAKKFGDDQAGKLVALLAYYAFLATFPLLLALTTILGLVLRDSHACNAICSIQHSPNSRSSAPRSTISSAWPASATPSR
jgi:uncharacterized BrkB/YihY/UPF0761 family membrane protein